jgi:hypothetical protein
LGSPVDPLALMQRCPGLQLSSSADVDGSSWVQLGAQTRAPVTRDTQLPEQHSELVAQGSPTARAQTPPSSALDGARDSQATVSETISASAMGTTRVEQGDLITRIVPLFQRLREARGCYSARQ